MVTLADELTNMFYLDIKPPTQKSASESKFQVRNSDEILVARVRQHKQVIQLRFSSCSVHSVHFHSVHLCSPEVFERLRQEPRVFS